MTKQNEINNVVLSLFSFDEHRMARTVYAAHDLEIDWRRFYNTIVILEGKGLLKKKICARQW